MRSARRRSAMSKTSRDLYLASRTAGDIAAAQRGPEALAKRVGRRSLIRAVVKALSR